MIFRTSFLLVLVFILSTVSAQDKNLKEFKSFNEIESETLFWFKDYTRPKLLVNNENSSVYFVDRFAGRTLNYTLVSCDLNKLELEANLPKFPENLRTSDLEKYHSNVSFLKNDKFSVIVGYGIIYVLKVINSVDGQKVSYVLKDSILTNGCSGEETVFLNKNKLLIVDKLQPKLVAEGGIKVSSFNLKRGKLKKENTFNNLSSMLFYYDENYSYSAVTQKYIYLYDVSNNSMIRMSHKFKNQKTIKLDLPKDQEYFNSLNQYIGTTKLMDTVQIISKSISRVINSTPMNEGVFLISQISEDDSIRLKCEILKENGLIVTKEFLQSELKIMSQGRLLFYDNKIYCLSAFGNINLLDESLTQNILMNAIYNEKPRLGIYVFNFD